MQIRILLGSLADVLTQDERARVEHLVNHGEAPDGVATLAQIIVNRNYPITDGQYRSILELVSGFSAAERLPADLRTQVLERD
jgi:hypothetical protein